MSLLNPTKDSGIRLRLIIISGFLFAFVFYSSAQKKDTSAVAIKYRNIPKISISSYTIYQKSLHLGYERVLDKSHSIYIFGGYNEFPKILNLGLSGTTITGTKDKTGYSIGAEFRFYLPMENKYVAPHGVFLAPYVSYYSFGSTNTISHTDSNGTSSASLTMKTGFYNVGLELGYQFVVFKRFVIDCELFGPSFTYYSFEAQLQGQLNGDPSEAMQAVIDALKAKLPLLNDLSSGKKIYSSGKASQKFPFIGFRYAVSIGFMF